MIHGSLVNFEHVWRNSNISTKITFSLLPRQIFLSRLKVLWLWCPRASRSGSTLHACGTLARSVPRAHVLHTSGVRRKAYGTPPSHKSHILCVHRVNNMPAAQMHIYSGWPTCTSSCDRGTYSYGAQPAPRPGTRSARRVSRAASACRPLTQCGDGQIQWSALHL